VDSFHLTNQSIYALIACILETPQPLLFSVQLFAGDELLYYKVSLLLGDNGTGAAIKGAFCSCS
jgi:hypothetical protein